MRETGAELWRWIEEGAHLYVCGDAKRMAQGRRVRRWSRSSRSTGRAGEKRRDDALVACVSGVSRRPPAATRRTCLSRASAGDGQASEAIAGTASARPAPIAASAAASSRRPDGAGGAAIAGDPDASGQFRPACSKGAALGETLGLEGRLLHPDDATARASPGTRRSTRVATASRRIVARARAGGGRLLPLGPAPDGGLLRRQQAREGLHRHAARRHQFAPVHGLLRRRPPARLRVRHRARLLRGPRRGRPPGARRLQRRLVPPGPVPAHAGRPATRAAPGSSSSTRARPRPREEADLYLADRARHRRCCSPASSSISPRRGALDRGLRRRAHDGVRRRARARPRDRAGRSPPRAARPALPTPTSRASSTCWSARRARRHPLQPGREPVGAAAPTRSTPSSTATSPPAGSAGRAAGRSRSPASPTPWAGARSAASPTCSPPIWASRPPRCDRVRRFWGAPRMATGEGLKAVALFDAVAKGGIKALWVMAHQPGRVAAGRGPGAGGAAPASTCSSSPRRRLQRHPRAAGARRAPARRRLGREGRHRHQLRAPHLAPARLPAPPGEARPDWWIVAEVARRMGFGAPSPTRPRPTSSASTRRSPPSRTTARASSTSAASPASTDAAYDALAPVAMAGPRRGDGRARPPLRRGRLLRRRTAAPASSPSRRPRARAATPAYPLPPQHRPRARPLAHHDPHRPVARASPATRPSPSWRSIPADAARWAWSEGDHAAVRTSGAARS